LRHEFEVPTLAKNARMGHPRYAYLPYTSVETERKVYEHET
jgi:hypothetical protein